MGLIVNGEKTYMTLKNLAVDLKHLEQGNLYVRVMDRGTAWLDTGTFDSLSDATELGV